MDSLSPGSEQVDACPFTKTQESRIHGWIRLKRMPHWLEWVPKNGCTCVETGVSGYLSGLCHGFGARTVQGARQRRDIDVGEGQ